MITNNTFYLSDKELWQKLNEINPKSGIYKLILTDNGKPKQIGRFLGTDNKGIIYIGKCDNVLDRVINLKKSISQDFNNNSHICGRRLKNIEKFYERIPFENLIIQITPSENQIELEKKQLNEYFQRFGEVPPLNAIP